VRDVLTSRLTSPLLLKVGIGGGDWRMIEAGTPIKEGDKI
jgi:hypothetical protein